MDNLFQALRLSGFATSIQNLNLDPVGKSKFKSYGKLNHIPVYTYAPEIPKSWVGSGGGGPGGRQWGV